MPLHVFLPSLPFPSLPSLLIPSGSLLNRYKPMVSRIGARPGSTVVAMADGGDLVPDDAVSEEATVVLTSSVVLYGTRGCTLIVGIMSLFDATLSWPPKAPPWPSSAIAFARTKLHLADPLARHSQKQQEERQIDDGGFCFGSTGNSTQQLANEGEQFCGTPMLEKRRKTNKAEETIMPTYADPKETYAVSSDSSGLCSHCKLFVEYIEGTCAKLEGNEGQSHSIFMLHPLQYLPLNASTTPRSASILCASDFLSIHYEINADLLEAMDKSRTVLNTLCCLQLQERELIADRPIECMESGLKV